MKNTFFWVAVLSLVGACADDPVAVRLDVQDVNVSTPEDTALVVQLQVDTNRQVQATVTTQPAHGVIADLGSNTFSYTPAKDYAGPDTIAVTFNNGIESVVGTAHITVTPVDDVPVANPDSFAAGFAATVTTATTTLLANDTDPEGDPLTVTEVSAASHGTVTLNGGTVTFVPEPNYQGAAGYAYRVSDGMMSSLGNVIIAVGTNNVPNATNDSAAGMEDTNAVIQTTTLLANDTDSDSQTLAITSVGAATHGTVSKTGNTITFTPDPNFNGAATFTYTVTDGAATDDGIVTINVAAVNDAPVIVADGGFTTNEDGQLIFTKAQLLGNDSDVDGDNLNITAVGNCQNCTVALPASAVGDSVVVTPNANYNGPISFTYTASDGTTTGTGTVTVTVGSVNDAPVAVDDTATGAEDTAIAIATSVVLANDTDVDGDTKTVSAVANPTHGTVTLNGGVITFTPTANYNGAATFDYTLSDGTTTDTGSVNVNVTAVNDAPEAIDDAATTAEDVAINIAVLLNDLDIDGEALMVMSTTQPAHGTVTVTNGVARYTPAANYKGNDSFTYVARDAGGLTSTATVAISITTVNDGPVAQPDAASTDEDTSVVVAAAANDTDADGDTLTIVSATTPAHGLATLSNGVLTYTPALNYFGGDSFTYTVSDGNGGSATGTVTVTVGPVNDAPVAVNDFYDVNDTIGVNAADGLLNNDTDVDSTNLTVVLDQPPLTGQLTLNADGSFVYTPDACTRLETFTYHATDGALSSEVVTVTLSLNRTPTAYYDNYTVQDTSVLTVASPGVLVNDTDPDFEPISAVLVSLPTHGTNFVLRPDGSFTYTPEIGFPSDSFRYQVTDGHTFSAPTTVDIRIYYCTPNNGSNGGGTCIQTVVPDPGFLKLVSAFQAAARPQCCGPINPTYNSFVYGCDIILNNAVPTPETGDAAKAEPVDTAAQ